MSGYKLFTKNEKILCLKHLKGVPNKGAEASASLASP